jgi:hypothetical protein
MPAEPDADPIVVATDPDAGPADLGPLVELLLEEVARREGRLEPGEQAEVTTSCQ